MILYHERFGIYYADFSLRPMCTQSNLTVPVTLMMRFKTKINRLLPHDMSRHHNLIINTRLHSMTDIIAAK